MSTVTRRTKWHPTPPPPPSPMILHFPRSRRARRKQLKSSTSRRRHHHRHYLSNKGKLESLFDQENHRPPESTETPVDVVPLNSNSKTSSFERRERVDEDGEEENGEKNRGGGANGFDEERLKAECNFLRMERDLALKKMDRNRVEMQRTVRSAIQNLIVAGRESLFEGENVNALLEEEIEDLAEKLEELQRNSRIKDKEIRNCSESKENSSVASSASTSKRIDQLSAISSSRSQEPVLHEMNKCSGRCKAIVRRIVEQVRAETEQWSQMQEMLGQVRGEMQELQATSDFWENRAHYSDIEIQSLTQNMEEWKEKALGYETKASELQLELSVLKQELQKAKSDIKQYVNTDHMPNQDSPNLRKQPDKRKIGLSWRAKENHWFDERRGKVKISCMDDDLNIEDVKTRTPTKDFLPISLGKQLAKEKKMLFHRLKENRHASDKNQRAEVRQKLHSNISGFVGLKRSPLEDIGNSHP